MVQQRDACLVRRMLHACQAAYYPGLEDLHRKIGWGNDYAVFEPLRDDLQRLQIDAALVGNIAEGVLVAFRGTLPPLPRSGHSPLQIFADWLNNLNFAAVGREPYPGKVHKGFADSLDRLWGDADRPGLGAEIAARLARAARRRLFVTGHSKGGALANLAAWRALAIVGLQDPIRVYTVAAARVGNEAWRDAYQAESRISCRRYESALDIVPWVPFGQDTPHWVRKVLGRSGDRLLAGNYVPVGARIPARTSPTEAAWVVARALRFLFSPRPLEDYLQVLGVAHDIRADSGYDQLVCDPSCGHLPI